MALRGLHGIEARLGPNWNGIVKGRVAGIILS